MYKEGKVKDVYLTLDASLFHSGVIGEEKEKIYA